LICTGNFRLLAIFVQNAWCAHACTSIICGKITVLCKITALFSRHLIPPRNSALSTNTKLYSHSIQVLLQITPAQAPHISYKNCKKCWNPCTVPVPKAPMYARTNQYSYSFLPRTIRDWNNLNIENLDNIDLETFTHSL